MKNRTYTAEIKQPHEIHECPQGRKVILLYPNGEEYHGIFTEIDDDLILLKPESGGDGSRLGFPINGLKFWLLKDK